MNLFNFNLNFGSLFWNRRKRKLLVVEDNFAVIEMIRWSAQACGMEVVVASSAEEAIGILSENGSRFLCVLIDIGLPGEGGWSLFKRLKSAWPELDICMMSASSDRLLAIPLGEKVSVYLKGTDYGPLCRELAKRRR